MKLITIILKQLLLVIFISLFLAGCSDTHDLPDVEETVIPISGKVENKFTMDGWKFKEHPVFPVSALAPRF